MKTACASSRQHFALLQPTEWALALETSLEFELESGDIVRGCKGLVWATVDGEYQDILLAPGETYQVPRAQRMRFNGYDAARMVILARGPVAAVGPRKSWDRALNGWISGMVERWMLGGRELNA